MKKIRIKKMLSPILSIMLIAAMALSATGCDNSKSSETSEKSSVSVSDSSEVQTENSDSSAPQEENSGSADIEVIGEGQTKFTFSVTDKDSNESLFEVHTDKKTVGEALLELNMIAGDEGEYGLYVKTVNGITADFDKDGVYWAFYIDGKYAETGVDSTEIKDGSVYSFKVE